jgi:hypothetical protein
MVRERVFTISTLLALAAVLAIVSLGSLVSDRAEAGGSQSAPTKYSGSTSNGR